MKAKLVYFAILMICAICVVSAGLLSVHRSEGEVISDEMQEQIDAIVDKIFPGNAE